MGSVALSCPAALAGAAAVLVRPEAVQLRMPDVPAMPAVGAHGAPRGQARVLQRLFLGDRVQLRLAVDGQPEPLVADQPRDCPAHEGVAVAITIDPSRLRPATQNAVEDKS